VSVSRNTSHLDKDSVFFPSFLQVSDRTDSWLPLLPTSLAIPLFPIMVDLYKLHTVPAWVQGLGYGRTFQTSNPSMDQKFVSSPKRPARLWDPPSLLPNGYRLSFPGVKRLGREVSHPSPPRSEMSGTTPLLPLHATITSTRRL